jgi:outer membrane protein assembly factor BamA
MSRFPSLKRLLPCILLPLACFFWAERGFSQYESPQPHPLESQPLTESTSRLTLFPFAFYSEDTGVAGGLAVNYASGSGKDPRLFSLGFTGYYTEHDRYSLLLKPEMTFGGGRSLLRGEIGYDYLSHPFYGVGNDLTALSIDQYVSRRFDVHLALQYGLSERFSLGPACRLVTNSVTAVDGSDAEEAEPLDPRRATLASGLGFQATWDSRDDTLYPTTGSLTRLEAIAYSPLFGSDFAITGITADLCAYRSVAGDHVIALRGYFGTFAGEPPYHMMYSLGDTLRGFGENLFVDDTVLSLQAEYRMPLFWRIGLVGFAGAGQVSDDPAGLGLDRFRPSAGIGMRIAVPVE